MKTDTVKLTQVEEVVILKMQDEKVHLKINEEHITLRVSGQGPAGTPGAEPVSCEKVRTEGLVDTWRLLMSNGKAFYFEIKNGEAGEPGPQGEPGRDGQGVFIVDEPEEALIIIGEAENYEGAYNVTPSSADQRLDTQGLMMQQNVTVEEIPFSETGNTSGGYTATIGG